MKYLVQESSSEYQVMMAASVMAILPVLILFVLFEKQLVKSVTLTGMKA
jgi:multiple sugar transport system permease protein